MGISEDDENILERKERNEEVLKMADEQRYIIPTIKKRKITYFGQMIRRNNINRMLLEGPLEGKNKQRKADNGEDHIYHRREGNAI